MTTVNVVEAGSAAALNYSEILWPSLSFDASTVDKDYETFYPQSALNQVLQANSSVTFDLPRSLGNVSYDLTDMELLFSVTLEPVDPASPIVDTEKTSISFNFTNCLIKSIKYYWNNVCIQSIQENVLWSYFEQLLNVDDQAKDTYLYPMGYGVDNNFDDCSDNNPGWKDRKLFFGSEVINQHNEKVFEYEQGRVAHFRMKFKHFINATIVPESVNTRIVLDLNDSKYGLMCAEGVAERKIVIKKLLLNVRRRTLKQSLYESFKLRWKNDPVRFFFNRYDTKIQILGPNSNTFFIDDITAGFSVSKIFIFLQSQKRFEGCQSLSPYKFERTFKGTKKLSNLCGWKFEMGERTIENHFKHNQDHLTFTRICDMLGFTGENAIFGLKYKQYMDQSYFMAWDLSVSTCNDEFLVPQVKTGRCRVTLNFTEELKESVVAFVVTEISTSAYVDDMGRVTIKNLV